MGPVSTLPSPSPIGGQPMRCETKAPPKTQSGNLDNKQGKAKTLTIFDWDDTLLSSSFLAALNYEVTAEQSREIEGLEAAVLRFISAACEKGDVRIVTNAEEGWVKMSGDRFLPKVSSLIEEKKIPVLSARSTYEPQFPEDPFQWKLHAMRRTLKEAFAGHEHERNIISFGDSECERRALLCATSEMPKTHTKCIKFAERPAVNDLVQQVEMATERYPSIWEHVGNLDLIVVA